MTNPAQEDINKLTNKERIRYLDLSNRELEGEMNLGEFKNLKSINASNNKFTNLDFLNSLENKEQVEKIKLLREWNWRNRFIPDTDKFS